jgi:hypothetical protein
MHINRIHLDRVALARSFAASVTAQQNILARLPGRPLRRGPPRGGGRFARFLRRLRIRVLTDRGHLAIYASITVRSHERRVPWLGPQRREWVPRGAEQPEPDLCNNGTA